MEKKVYFIRHKHDDKSIVESLLKKRRIGIFYENAPREKVFDSSGKVRIKEVIHGFEYDFIINI